MTKTLPKDVLATAGLLIAMAFMVLAVAWGMGAVEDLSTTLCEETRLSQIDEALGRAPKEC